jgi:hypothetical protein
MKRSVDVAVTSLWERVLGGAIEGLSSTERAPEEEEEEEEEKEEEERTRGTVTSRHGDVTQGRRHSGESYPRFCTKPSLLARRHPSSNSRY